jgi:predicted DNA-binding transcriptional regulator YafY
MKFIEKKEKLDYMIALIKQERTGSAEEFSNHIFVSKRTLLRYIDELRELGYQIGYCIYRNTYYFIEKKLPDSKILASQ